MCDASRAGNAEPTSFLTLVRVSRDREVQDTRTVESAFDIS
jgi:hypothetical protein